MALTRVADDQWQVQSHEMHLKRRWDSVTQPTISGHAG